MVLNLAIKPSAENVEQINAWIGTVERLL